MSPQRGYNSNLAALSGLVHSLSALPQFPRAEWRQPAEVRLRALPALQPRRGRGRAGGQEMPRSVCHLLHLLVETQELRLPSLGPPENSLAHLSPQARPRGTLETPGRNFPPNFTAMSKLGKLFKRGGSSKSRAAPSPQEALARLRETEEMLGKKQEYLENRIQRELTLAKKHGTQNKRAALEALKRKKRLEKQLTQIDGTLSTIEFQREALENSYTNTEVLRNMGFAAKAMKTVHENMDLNKIDDLMQDITEQQDIAQEISEAFSQRAGFGNDFDEDELMAELEELEQEELNKKMTNIRLPNVPSSSLPAQPDRLPSMSSSAHRSRAASSRRTEDDDDIKQLTAWAT